MPNIFISYRRDDASVEARELLARLQKSIGRGSVFLDLEVLSSGQDFSSVLEQRISESEAMIVLIGPRWLAAAPYWVDSGRLDDQGDFVRREIELAIRLGKRVVPVLVGGAEMPDASALPISLEWLTGQSAMVLRPERLEADMEVVVRALTGQSSAGATSGFADVFENAKLAFSLALAVIGFAAILGVFGWGVTKITPVVVHYAKQFFSNPAQVDLLSNLALAGVLVVGAAAGARVLYRDRQRLVAAAFNWWVRKRNVYPNLGPGCGFVEGPIDESMLGSALPSEYPHAWETISGVETDDASGPTEDHRRRAVAWASRLNQAVHDDSRFQIHRGEAMTTFGFISIVGVGLQLAVIQYLSPLRAFAAVGSQRLPRHIEIDGWRFPVIVRPWLPMRHGSPKSFGNCWVRCPAQGRTGMLTALHAVSPKSLGKSVSIDVQRTPRRGHLLRVSAKMDAAVIVLSEQEWGGKKPVLPSSVIGYKPVRLLSSTGGKDGQVVEVSEPTIWLAKPGQEPLNGNMLFFSPSLQPGDSGCLVLDREHKNQPPYLMYLGKTTLSNTHSYGYGVLLEQARRVWELDFFT